MHSISAPIITIAAVSGLALLAWAITMTVHVQPGARKTRTPRRCPQWQSLNTPTSSSVEATSIPGLIWTNFLVQITRNSVICWSRPDRSCTIANGTTLLGSTKLHLYIQLQVLLTRMLLMKPWVRTGSLTKASTNHTIALNAPVPLVTATTTAPCS
jgi:hypothetical protein